MTIDKRKLASNFSKVAKTYEANAVLQQTVTARLLERLQLIKIAPRWIVDVGSGSGNASRQLAARYKKATVVALDLSLGMLATARSLSPKFFSRQLYVCGDVEKIPLDRSVTELVFSSLVLQWCDDLSVACLQVKNALKAEGLFMFAMLGADTMKELRASWAEADARHHVNTFFDMHDIGDVLVRAGFVEPVLDVEHITMTYADTRALMHDIQRVGAVNVDVDRARGLTGKGAFRRFVDAYEQWRVDGRLPLTYEIVYGHAWAPPHGVAAGSGHEVTVPVASIGIRR